jgi:hypothetical protein
MTTPVVGIDTTRFEIIAKDVPDGDFRLRIVD